MTGKGSVKLRALQAAFPHTVPILTGFLFLGMTYGVYVASLGFSWVYPTLMAMTIYAGSMEFVTANMLLGAFNPLQAFVMTLMVNARHLFAGISRIDKYKGAGKKKPYLIFALTDETYSLVCRDIDLPAPQRHRYCFLVSLFDQIYWVTGSVLGALAGAVLPFSVEGIDFALTALFVTVFVEQWLSTKDHTAALAGLGASMVCLLIFGSENFLIPAMIAITLLLTLLRGRKGGAA